MNSDEYRKLPDRSTYARRLGFTLIELMIIVVIVAVLASLALASYQSYVIKARRSDAKDSLINVALAQERFRSNCPSYAGSITAPRPVPPTPANCAGMVGLGLSSLSSERFYMLALPGVSTVDFTVTATAVAGMSQAKDTGCTVFTFMQDGTRMPIECW